MLNINNDIVPLQTLVNTALLMAFRAWKSSARNMFSLAGLLDIALNSSILPFRFTPTPNIWMPLLRAMLAAKEN